MSAARFLISAFALFGVGLVASASCAQTVVSLGNNQRNFVRATAIDAQGNIFTADWGAGSVKEFLADGNYQTVRTLGTGDGSFSDLQAIALDTEGNVFVADLAGVKEIAAEGGYAAAQTLSTRAPVGTLAVDDQDNLFFVENGQITELLAAGGYSVTTSLGGAGGAITSLGGLAIDAAGNLFFVDDKTSGVSVKEITSASSYATTMTLLDENTAIPGVGSLAIDADGNLLLNAPAANMLFELRRADAYGVVVPVAVSVNNFSAPRELALDKAGNVFFADSGNNAVKEIAAGGAVTVIGSGFSSPASVALDNDGNLFVADQGNNAVKEILAAGGYSSIVTLAGGFAAPSSVAVDRAGDVFVSDGGNHAVKEILAEGGYSTVRTLVADSAGFFYGLAVDGQGNLFGTEYDFGLPGTSGPSVWELLAAGGYSTYQTLPFGTVNARHAAFDARGNLYLIVNGAVSEYLASSGYATVGQTLYFNDPEGIALDPAGNLYVSDSLGDNALLEVIAAPSPLAGAVLPASRSVQAGDDATIFATLINTSDVPLANCGAWLPLTAPASLSMTFQATDPSTNEPTGTPNAPVSIAAKDSQTFLLDFQAANPLAAAGLAPVSPATTPFPRRRCLAWIPSI